MLDNIEAVIFDLDGTLIDSMWMWKDIDIEFLNQYGIAYPENLQDSIEGMSFTETAMYFKERFQLPDSIEDIKKKWNEMAQRKYAEEVPLKSGVRRFLEYLKANNIMAGIATSNSRELVNLIIDKHNMKDYFTSIRTSCEVKKGKPAPDIYQLVAEDLQVSPKTCLVFEDVVQGIMAGKNAQMKVCAVYDEHSEINEKEKIRLADYFIRSFDDLF